MALFSGNDGSRGSHTVCRNESLNYLLALNSLNFWEILPTANNGNGEGAEAVAACLLLCSANNSTSTSGRCAWTFASVRFLHYTFRCVVLILSNRNDEHDESSNGDGNGSIHFCEEMHSLCCSFDRSLLWSHHHRVCVFLCCIVFIAWPLLIIHTGECKHDRQRSSDTHTHWTVSCVVV